MRNAECGISVVAPDGMPCWMQHVGYWLHHQQTLITGLLAVVVGGVTIYFLHRQISQQQKFADEQSSRRLRAVRAGLPFALSEIHEYSRSCIDILCHFLKRNGELNGDTQYDFELEPQTLASLPVISPYPTEAFKAIQVVIEHAGIGEARKLQEIVAYGQIQQARFRGLTDRVIHGKDASWVVTAENIMSAIRDATGLMLHMERVYDYARESGPEIHDLGDAVRASDALLWLNLGGDNVRKYVLAHWPPDFPNRIPQQGNSMVPVGVTE